MGQRLVLAGIVGLLLVAGRISQANAQELRPRDTASTLPFELVSDFVVVVHAQVGELQGLRFILDTGSSHTVIDRRVADTLGFRRHPGRVINFDRYIPVDWADLPQLRVGPLQATALHVMIADLADYSAFGRQADGIIGMDLLSRASKLAIDYEKRLVSIEIDPESKGDAAPPNGFVVPVAIQGVSMRLLVDTGFQGILLYKDRLHNGLPNLRTEGEPQKAVIGRMQATQVNLPGVQIFGRDAVTPVLLIDGPNADAGTDVGAVDGYLGPASLHAKRLELDFASKVLRWQ
jgi:predicted aspartyl protease